MSIQKVITQVETDGQGGTGSQGAQGGQGATGAQGATGPAGTNGATGATGVAGLTPWTFVGAYDNGADYTYGDAVTYQGGFYYRTGNPNNPGYPPTPGSINASWTPVADGGATGATGETGATGSGTTGATGLTGATGALTGAIDFTEGTSIPSATTINDYNLPDNSVFKISGTTSSNIQGFANGVSGRFVIIVNNTDKNQTFVQESTGSTASNRFVLGQANRTIGINQTATFIYVTGLTIGGVSGQSRWVLVALT